MRREPKVVKTAPTAPKIATPRRDFRRHLQGYELGLLTVGMVLTFALLALPRASVPETLPLPRIDRAEARQSAKTERELAAQAEATGLPFELRAVGESIRHFGRSVVHGLDTQHDRQDIHERLAAALAKGQGPLLVRLRAVQTEYFLRALGQSAHLGPKERGNPDLDELGGDFLAHAKQNGWLDAQGQFLADDATRRVLFHMHWADLVEKRSTFPFAATLNEWRIYYRFLLEHPELGALQSGDSAADTQRLRVVNALSRKDPDYPRFFAKGYLLYRLGDREAAAAAYRAQLGQNGSGRYALLTRNYLIHTLQGGESE